MYNNLQNYFVQLSVFSLALCETAIAQRSTKLHRGQTRLMITLIVVKQRIAGKKCKFYTKNNTTPPTLINAPM